MEWVYCSGFREEKEYSIVVVRSCGRPFRLQAGQRPPLILRSCFLVLWSAFIRELSFTEEWYVVLYNSAYILGFLGYCRMEGWVVHSTKNVFQLPRTV